VQTTGTLYIVATPIGNLDDFSQRGINILRTVNWIAAEDTRHSGYLLAHFAIDTRTVSLHEHNEDRNTSLLLDYLIQGQSVALISDAGTPLISDPGYRLVHQAREKGIKISPVPGPCALIAALSSSGLPSDRFIFEGFLPAKASARQKRLANLQAETRTLIFYESPHRIIDTISDMISAFGMQRRATIARELTKVFETIYSATLSHLKAWMLADNNQQKGEFVLLIKGIEETEQVNECSQETKKLLTVLLKELPLSQAVSITAKISREKKNRIYEYALQLGGTEHDQK
jgi:16S rRNA (cytidine1402-2'-O)-methyltransferase